MGPNFKLHLFVTKSEFWSKIGHRDPLWASHGQDNHRGTANSCNCPALNCHSPIIGTILKKQFMTVMIAIYTYSVILGCLHKTGLF